MVLEIFKYCYRWSLLHRKAKSSPGIFTTTHLESTKNYVYVTGQIWFQVKFDLT